MAVQVPLTVEKDQVRFPVLLKQTRRLSIVSAMIPEFATAEAVLPTLLHSRPVVQAELAYRT